jgi:pilus assembly protein CpaC
MLALALVISAAPRAAAVDVIHDHDVDVAGAPSATIDIAPGAGRLLRFNRRIDSLLIGDPTVADVKAVSGQLIYVFGSAPGRTNLIVVTGDDHIAAAIAVVVSRDAEGIQRELKKALPDAAVDLSFIGNRLVVKGQVKSVDEAVDVSSVAKSLAPRGTKPLNHSSFASSHQINIRVRFAQVSRSSLNSLGVNWSAAINSGALNFALATGSFLQSAASSPATAFGTLASTVSTRHANVNALIDALQQEGVVTLLAEPNLTTVSGETASFLAGGEIPIPVPQSLSTTTIEYKPFGVSLSFTPTLLPGDRIGLRVRPEVSSISASNSVSVNGYSVPALTVSRADTTIEVASGDTFAIAGLFQQDVNNAISKFPWVGDLPVLGPLFRSESFQRNESELLILITPYIVRPTTEPGAPLPTDLLPGASAAPPPVLPSGTAGFIIQ